MNGPAPYLQPSVSADRFVDSVEEKILSGERFLEFQGIEVAGVVDLSGSKFAHELSISGVVFRDAVRLQNCVFESRFELKNCSFDGPLDLSNTRFDLGFVFRDCRFGLPDVELSRRTLILDDASASGWVGIYDTVVNGLISGRRLRLNGNMGFGGCTIEGAARSGGQDAVVDFNSAHISGDINFELGGYRASDLALEWMQYGDGESPPMRFRSTFTDVEKAGALSLRHAQVTNVRLAMAKFVGTVDLHHLICQTLTSIVWMFGARPGEVVEWKREHSRFGGAEIDGDLVFSTGDFGFIRLRGMVVTGSVLFVDGKSGQIDIADGIETGQNSILIVLSQLGNLFMSSWNCRDFVRIHPSAVSGRRDERGFKGISLQSCTIARRLCFWPGHAISTKLQDYFDASTGKVQKNIWILRPGEKKLENVAGRNAQHRVHVNRWLKHLTVSGRLMLKHCTIGENVDLTNVIVEEDDSNPGGGRIDLIHCSVKGDIKFDSPVSHLADPSLDPSVLQLGAQFLVASECLASRLPSTGRLPEYCGYAVKGARCDAANFHDLSAEEVELSGLTVKKAEEPVASDATASPGMAQDGPPGERPAIAETGHIKLTSAEIRGRVATLARLSSKSVADAFADVVKVTALGKPPAAPTANSGTRFPAVLLQPRPVGDFRWRMLVDCFGTDAIAWFNNNYKPGIAEVGCEASAVIPGALNLRHATIDELVISDSSFRDSRESCKAASDGIVLSYAKLNKLYVARRVIDDPPVPATWLERLRAKIVSATAIFWKPLVRLGRAVLRFLHLTEPTARPERAHNGFPVPLNLLDLEVRSWFLESDSDRPSDGFVDKETATVDPYLDLLDNDRDFRMSSYLAVERALRDRGLEKEATHVFIAARYRDMRNRIGKRAEKGQEQRSAMRKWLPVWLFELFVWRPGDGRYRKGMLVPLLRLRRPPLEYLSVLICTLWIVGFVAIFARAPWPWSVIGFVAAMIVGFISFRTPVFVFIDHLYWSIIDYGTSAARLAIVILTLMLLTFVLATDRNNFEPTLLARTQQVQRDFYGMEASSQKAHDQRPVTARDAAIGAVVKSGDARPLEGDWPILERVWMTLRYHVPLVDAVIADEWQPSIRPMTLHFLSPDGPRAVKPAWWPFSFWPRARDWFGVMLWLNWILWPLFLPYLIRTMTRSR